MSELILNALVHLFAIFESAKEDFEHDTGELIVKPYLDRRLNPELVQEYLNLFYDYLNFYRQSNQSQEQVGIGIDSASIIQIAKICNQINHELLQRERITVFIELLELIRADEKVSDKEDEFASLVAMNFNLSHKEVEDIKAFIFDPDGAKISKEKTLIVDNKLRNWPEEMARMMKSKKQDHASTRYMYVEGLFGRILVLQISSIETYIFRYDGPLNLYLEGNKVQQRKAYFLKPGAIIKGPNIRSIYETEITQHFLKEKNHSHIVFNGEELSFQFENSTNGIHTFNFSEEAGRLVGIMGGSGTGKTTLLNLLNGKLEPTTGRVMVNGHTIQKAARAGVIGYVPQDDLLFEELTVFQNLYYNARICFSDFSDTLIEQTVDKVLRDLDLLEIKELKVGNPLNKSISGGQRKRLNIALELMREPTILFVDEPTSGLSSMDSEKVMWLLKDQARKGKLVIVIIHQPSSDIFKLFDKLWLLDKGGYPIYNGNPIDAVVYFKTMNMQVNAAESECTKCGNVIPDQILEIVEAKKIDDLGKETNDRRINPWEWYRKYQENIEKNLKRTHTVTDLPESNFNIPGRFDQFKIFSLRNIKAKWANNQYMTINVLQAPLLALILAYFSKYDAGGTYVFAENKNLPVFLFMSIVVAMFMGMTVSAEEIFKDRKILDRESFLNLSWSSYLHAKMTFLFLLSAFQTGVFVAVSHYILEIKGQFFHYWLILFTTACFANMVGLAISSALSSIIAIYILIPFVLVPQMLLGGAMIHFDDLHSGFTNKKQVPIVGEIMASRWAYEALSVAQFRHNEYEKHFFEVEQQMSEASFVTNYQIPKLESFLKIINDAAYKEDYAADIDLLRREILTMEKRYDLEPFPNAKVLITVASFNEEVAVALVRYFDYLKTEFRQRYNKAATQKDAIYYRLVDAMGRDQFLELRQAYFNQNLSDILTNRTKIEKIIVTDEMLIQKKDPVYMRPYQRTGRAHFYAPFKYLGNWQIDTVVFNVLMIWAFVVVIYFGLIGNVYQKIILAFNVKRK